MHKVGYRSVANIVARCALAFALLTPALPALAAGDSTECQYHIDLEYEMNMPIYHWAPVGSAKGVVMLMHGLVMHGQCFDELAKKLASQGFLVYATDMRGYGRLTKEYPHEFCSEKDCKQKVNYKKSEKDLVSLADKLKKDHKGLPLYMVGESMGAGMAIRIASQRPELADGLILSAPAIRTHNMVDTNAMKILPFMMANFKQQLDLSPYVRKYASEDPEIVQELFTDPLVRKHLSTEEIVASRRCINETLSYVDNISSEKPVLVLQAKDDKCVRADAVETMVAHLKANDQQVRWFDERGHILIETAHIRPDTMQAIVGWLNVHNEQPHIAISKHSADELISVEAPQSPNND